MPVPSSIDCCLRLGFRAFSFNAPWRCEVMIFHITLEGSSNQQSSATYMVKESSTKVLTLLIFPAGPALFLPRVYRYECEGDIRS